MDGKHTGGKCWQNIGCGEQVGITAQLEYQVYGHHTSGSRFNSDKNSAR